MNIHDILMKRAAKNELAHFYIIESSEGETEALASLMKFTHGFVKEYYQDVEGSKEGLTNYLDHPDVYVLGNLPDTDDREDKPFTVEDSEAFARFFEFKPVQAKRKFAVITEGHRINNIVANKWLKLLEEPTGNATILLLNPRRQKLLDTIHSRAQHLRLPVSFTQNSLEDWIAFLTETKAKTLAQFIETNMKSGLDVFFLTGELIRWEAEKIDSIESKMALSEWIKKLQEMEIFHQPSATKWTLFYSFLRSHVLPRL